MRACIVVFFCVFGLTWQSFSQNEINYSLIDSIGKSFTSSLKTGDIAYLKESKPPKNTWTYDGLVAYKEALEKYPDDLIIGSFLEPSKNASLYAFNLFAYRRVDETSFKYYFAAIVSVDVSNTKYQLQSTYLFTEPEALKNWWMHVFGFYQGVEKDKIPKKFSFPVCPPPPFKIE